MNAIAAAQRAALAHGHADVEPAAKTAAKRKRSNAKGSRFELHAIKLLEAQGYSVERARRKIVRIEGKPRAMHVDMWECIDLIALRFDRPVLFVQVGRKQDMREKERDCALFAKRKAPREHSNVEVWGYVEGARKQGGQRFRVTRWNGLEWGECEDQVCVVQTR